MKVGILSLPFNWNYGGILQTYALKTLLESLGHNVIIISRRKNRPNLIRIFPVWFKWKIIELLHYFPFLFFKPIIAVEHFKRKQIINITPNIFSDKKLNRIFANIDLDAIVVGSDQVWNINSAPHIKNYFLDFTLGKSNIKRIAFSASFGKEEWAYSDEITSECAMLTKHFDAISVREDSGVFLCKKYFQINAIHLLDPTLLLGKNFYCSLIKKSNTKTYKEKLFTYILDHSEKKQSITKYVSEYLNILPYEVKKGDFKGSFLSFLQGYKPTIEQWLRAFYECDFVITDSFHGTIFAIIFNKPFLSIANEERGLARFESLLKVFQLENRFFSNVSEIPKSFFEIEIDWDNVNKKIEVENQKSIQFLKQNLK